MSAQSQSHHLKTLAQMDELLAQAGLHEFKIQVEDKQRAAMFEALYWLHQGCAGRAVYILEEAVKL